MNIVIVNQQIILEPIHSVLFEITGFLVNNWQAELTPHRAESCRFGLFYSGVFLKAGSTSRNSFRLLDHRRGIEINLMSHHIQEFGHLSN
jgi:hypothetical protein